jgi:hypothetical protein
MFSERAERRALFLVALQFFMLVPFIVYEAPGKLVSGGEIETSWLGMGLALATLAIRQPLGFREAAPGRAARVRRVGEGTQDLLCGYLIAVLIAPAARGLEHLGVLQPVRGASFER